MRSLVLLLATGLYTGYVPIAPGTAGSVLGLVLAIGVCAPLWRRWPAAFVILFVVLFAIACVISGAAEKILEQPDSPHIVIDEVMGMIATMYLNPTGWGWLVAGFVLFRIFDIIKPFPANFLERRVSGGAGVMLDDLASGIYANLVLQVARLFI